MAQNGRQDPIAVLAGGDAVNRGLKSIVLFEIEGEIEQGGGEITALSEEKRKLV